MQADDLAVRVGLPISAAAERRVGCRGGCNAEGDEGPEQQPAAVLGCRAAVLVRGLPRRAAVHAGASPPPTLPTLGRSSAPSVWKASEVVEGSN